MSVCTAEPWSIGLMFRLMHSGLWCTINSTPCSFAMASRKVYIAWNFHSVSTCTIGNGSLDG